MAAQSAQLFAAMPLSWQFATVLMPFSYGSMDRSTILDEGFAGDGPFDGFDETPSGLTLRSGIG
jgi:hypothetical protein